MSERNLKLYQQSGGEWWFDYTNECGNQVSVVAYHRMDLVVELIVEQQAEIERLKKELEEAKRQFPNEWGVK